MIPGERTRYFSAGLLSILLAFAAIAASPDAPPHDTLAAAAARFAAAYASGDVVTLRALWSGDGALARAMTSKLRVKCLQSAAAIVTSADESSGIARATVARWEWPREGDAKPQLVVKHLVLTFQDGRFSKLDVAERALADELVAKPEAASEILRANDELLTPDLVRELYTRGYALSAKGAAQEAEAVARTLEHVAALLADPDQESRAVLLRAVMKYDAGDVRAQLEYARRSIALAEPGGDPDLLLRGTFFVARAYERMPDKNEEALKAYQHALSFEPGAEEVTAVARAYAAMAGLMLRRSDTAGAMNAFARAEAINLAQEDDFGLSSIERGMAVLFQNQGNDALAFTHLQRGLESAARAQDDAERAEILVLLGDAYLTQGREKESAAALTEGLAIARRTRNQMLVGEGLRISSVAHARKREYAAALRDLDESVAALKSASRPRFLSFAMLEQARVKLESGDAHGAVEAAETTAALTRRLGLHSTFLDSETIAGRAHHALGENDAALAAFDEAIAVAEARRAWITGDPGAQELSFESASSPYRRASEVLAEMGRLDEAFTMAERAKARVLLDTLRSGRERIDEAMSLEERRHDADLTTRIAALNRRLATAKDADATAKVNADLHDARAEYETFQTALYAAHPRLRQTRGEIPIATRADVARILDPSTAIVMYQVMDDRTTVLLLTSNGRSGAAADIQRFTIDVDRDALTKRISAFTSALSKRNLNYAEPAHALYDVLLRPMERALQKIEVLCIIPDDALWELPFEALMDRSGKFVVQSRACFYAPSASVLLEVMRGPHEESASHELLAVGNPTLSPSTRKESKAIYRDATLLPLPNAEEEVRALRTLYGRQASQVYVGAAATETAVKTMMPQYRILHFATHAEVNNENPMYAHIVLAQDKNAGDDGLLEAWEILRMDLHADMAVLSACETARGRVATGEGMIGIPWALFVAGCPSSVVSHWKVNSASTAELMVDFHQHLLSGKHAFQKAAALRQAKLDMLRKGKWQHPFYWSAFVLVGRG